MVILQGPNAEPIAEKESKLRRSTPIDLEARDKQTAGSDVSESMAVGDLKVAVCLA